MPSLTAHYLFGEEVLKNLDNGEKSLIERNRAFYDWGTLGPDILFFTPKMKDMWGELPVRKIGQQMHEQGAKPMFDAMMKYAEKSEQIKAYLYGFLCHIALDGTVHPLVYSVVDVWKKNDENVSDFELHLKVEADMETVSIRWLKDGLLPPEFKLYRIFEQHMFAVKTLAQMYAEAIKEVYGGEITARQVESAVTGTYFVMKKSYDRTGLKKNLVYTVESIKKMPHLASSFIMSVTEDTDRDYLNSEEREWTNVFTGETSEDSYFTLFEKAVEKAAEQIKGFGMDVENISLKTGERI